MPSKYAQEVLSQDVKVARYAHGINVKTYHHNPAVAVAPLDPGQFRGSVGTCWRPHIHDMFGQNEFDAGVCQVKDLQRGEKKDVPLAGDYAELIEVVKKLLG